MRWDWTATLLLGCGLGLGVHALAAQAPSSSSAQNQSQPGAKPKDQQESNPFPDDANSVPVLPARDSAATPPPDAGDYGNISLPASDADPVKSPDDAAATSSDSGSSSSSAGMDNLVTPPADEQQGKHGKDGALNQPHVETAKEDENVGSYYLDQKNWKAALSRYESAVVLDPENQDVYWGLAESQRHVGDFAKAKANYLKVMEYDPDSKHSKDAKKILQQPEMATAKALASSASAK